MLVFLPRCVCVCVCLYLRFQYAYYGDGQPSASFGCEDGGERKFLNFGHTFGHAVEAASGFGKLSHGECVMIGMGYAFLLSEKYGRIPEGFTERYLHFAKNNGYTFNPVFSYSFEELVTYMQKDKKASFGKMNFVLLQKVGEPFVKEISRDECQTTFEEFKEKLESEGIV